MVVPLRFHSIALLALVLSGYVTPAAAQDFDYVGRASVIDGDSIEIAGLSIRLHGIDAPEASQRCEAADGKAYRCGREAAFALDEMLRGRVVHCNQVDTDRYNRSIARCYFRDDGALISVNATMVSWGMALAYRRYSRDYVDYEDAARSAKRGIWAGRFEEPWEFRKRNR